MIRNLLHKDPRFASIGLKYSTQLGNDDGLLELPHARMPKITDPEFLKTIISSDSSDCEGLSQSIFGTNRDLTVDFSSA
jgi:hypothetical protein